MPKGDPVKPFAQQVRFSNRSRFLGQDQKDSLEYVFSMVPIAQKFIANAQHHRAVTHGQGCKRGLTGRISLRSKPVQELAVRQPGDRAPLIKRPDLADYRRRFQRRHRRGLPEKSIS
jgi:hypothetical protein